MKYDLLIVDDEKTIADILCETFEDEGFTCKAIYSGFEAIEFLKTNIVLLILSDIQMPNGSGVDILDYLQFVKNPPKILFMTGYSTYSKDELKQKGALEIFNKPVDIDYIIERLKVLISKIK